MIGQCCVVHAQNWFLFTFLKETYYVSSLTARRQLTFSNACTHVTDELLERIDDLIKKIGLNNSEVACLVCTDARVSAFGASKFSQPFGEKCVPICIDKLINAFRREGLNPLLFELSEHIT